MRGERPARRVAPVAAGALLVAALGMLVLHARAADSQYQIALPDRVEVEPGSEGSVSLTIAARPGYSISRDGPLAIELSAGAGLKLPRTEYHRDDAADARADNPRFDLRFRALSAGDHPLELALRFWVCTRRTCRPVHERRTVTVAVTAPPPATDGGVDDGGAAPRPGG